MDREIPWRTSMTITKSHAAGSIFDTYFTESESRTHLMMKEQEPLTPTYQMRFFQNSLPRNGLDIIDHELLAINGFLDPDGGLHACQFQHHRPLLHTLGFRSEPELEKSGWIKLGNMHWQTKGQHTSIRPTDSQKRTIELWFHRNQQPLSRLNELFI
jgi:hypothetical protein